MNTRPLVTLEVVSGLGNLVLARPEKRNAISLPFLEDFDRALEAARSDPSLRALLITAEGPVFSAGMDLKEVDLLDMSVAARFASALMGVYRDLMFFPTPVFAAASGPAFGGGVGILGASDRVWVSEPLSFSLTETRLGLVPALVSVPLTRRVSRQGITSLAVTGREATAGEALRLGLVDHIDADPEGSAEEAARTAVEVCSDQANRRTKQFLASNDEEGILEALARARDEFCFAVASPAAKVGLKGFREGRTIQWQTETEFDGEGEESTPGPGEES